MEFYHLDNIGYTKPLDTLVGIIFFCSFLVISFSSSRRLKLHENYEINFLINYIFLIIFLSQLMFLISFIGINLKLWEMQMIVMTF